MLTQEIANCHIRLRSSIIFTSLVAGSIVARDRSLIFSDTSSPGFNFCSIGSAATQPHEAVISVNSIDSFDLLTRMISIEFSAPGTRFFASTFWKTNTVSSDKMHLPSTNSAAFSE
jgi:hypothetical protein